MTLAMEWEEQVGRFPWSVVAGPVPGARDWSLLHTRGETARVPGTANSTGEPGGSLGSSLAPSLAFMFSGSVVGSSF